MSQLDKLAIMPKKLFLIDSLGALVTALLLSQVLARFEQVFGMPKDMLYFLAALAGLLAIYSFTCHLRLRENWRPFLKAIAIANVLYCLLTLNLMIYFREDLTALGFAYFIGEIIIVLVLARIEIAVSTKYIPFRAKK